MTLRLKERSGRGDKLFLPEETFEWTGCGMGTSLAWLVADQREGHWARRLCTRGLRDMRSEKAGPAQTKFRMYSAYDGKHWRTVGRRVTYIYLCFKWTFWVLRSINCGGRRQNKGGFVFIGTEVLADWDLHWCTADVSNMEVSHVKTSLEHDIPTAMSHFVISHPDHKTMTHQCRNFSSLV